MSQKKIVEKIQVLVGEGIHNIREMECAINAFVKNDIFKGESLPPQTSRRFFPERTDLGESHVSCTNEVTIFQNRSGKSFNES